MISDEKEEDLVSGDKEDDRQPLTWITKPNNNFTSHLLASGDQQQLLCITFTSEDGQTHHTETAEPIFIDFSGNQKSGDRCFPPDSASEEANYTNYIGSTIDNVSLASISEDINFETKLKVLDAVLPTAAKEKPSKYRIENGVYFCDLCDANFVDLENCTSHVKEHSKKSAYLCPTCNLPCKSHIDLVKHCKETHKEDGLFRCGKCSLVFGRQTQLKYHERRVHLQERSQVCQFCGKGFFKRCDLKMHLNIHLGIMKNICEICGKQFHHRSNLIRHSRLHSGVKPYVCCTCGVRFNQVSALKNHISHRHPVGNKKDGYPCPSCGKIMTTIAVLKKHLKLVHKSSLDSAVNKIQSKETSSRKFYCKICGLNFNNQSALHDHEKETHASAEEFSCKSCNQKFKSIGDIKTHCCVSPIGDTTRLMVKQLLDMQTDDFSEEEENLVSEEVICNETVPPNEPVEEVISTPTNDGSAMREMVFHVQAEGHSELMAVHVKYDMNYIIPTENQDVKRAETNIVKPVAPEIVKNEIPKIAEIPKPPEKEAPQTKKFACGDCGKSFSKKHNYKQHLATHNIELKKYVCKICNQVYAWKSSLNKHVLMNHTEKSSTYLCNLCPKSFNRSQAFSEHVRRDHIGEKPHKCAQCGKAFFKKSDLTVHTRIHSNDKPYICGTCGKTFSHVSHIIRHERIHSGVRPYSCDVCGKAFAQSTALRMHKMKLHDETALISKQQSTKSVDSSSAASIQIVNSALSESEQILENLFDNELYKLKF
ncbi:zinc finger protein 85-like [Cloeon dipterum]|uniref:zinc finger protein 85-like n=1 Tax=Cloeon dipterum TaxID=197152 RepID=UPI0032206F5D